MPESEPLPMDLVVVPELLFCPLLPVLAPVFEVPVLPETEDFVVVVVVVVTEVVVSF